MKTKFKRRNGKSAIGRAITAILFLVAAFLIASAFASLNSCKSATYEWDDGEWRNANEELVEETGTVTVIITIQ